ncbi:uncharacterized protein [Amphiura filiformis]|uniref:uncharacterized protein n=1 Tax=Amphiura filiformis TaxID=82378 RepID=UPI003B21D55A
MSAKQSTPKADLDKLFEETKDELGLKLEYLRSVDDYCTSEAHEAICRVNYSATSIIKGKSKEKICDRVVDFMLEQGLAKLIVKILQSLIKRNYKSAYESKDYTHSIVNNLTCRIKYQAKQRVKLELVKSGIVYPLLQDLESCDAATKDPRQRIRILRNISQLQSLTVDVTPSVIPIYRAAKAVDILMKFTQVEYAMIKVNSLRLLARIANEKESGRLVTSGTCIATIVEMLQKAVESDELCYMYTIKIDDENEKPFRLWVRGLAEGLNDLSTNDVNKTAIVQYGGVPTLMSILTPKPKAKRALTNWEQLASVEALWKLALYESTREAVITHLNLDTTVLEELQKLAKLKSSSNSAARLRDASIGLLIQIEKIDIHEPLEDQVDSSAHHNPPPSYEETTGRKRVMISYNWEHQKTAIKIRDKLKHRGFDTWMDVNEMRGNILQAMAEGIERADVMLMCFSRHYKASACCRAEVKYAFKLQKPIIPVKVEKYYEPDGWLGIVAAMDLYIKAYSDDVLEDSWSQLFGELENIGNVEHS